MDKIFNEIKKAIEEEMRNAESGPPPGGGRPQGGRRAQEYAEWLKEEQDRLRGDRGQEVSQPEPLQEMPVEVDEQPQRQRERRSERPQRSGQQRPQREQQRSGQGSQRQQRERQQSREQSARAQESSADQRQRQRDRDRERDRRQRQRQRQPELPTAADMRHRIERQLRSPGGLRMAFLMREIVSKPVSLRDKDDHLIS